MGACGSGVLALEPASGLSCAHRMSDIPQWAKLGRQGWRYTGASRPDFAIPPGPGQESVWDYPRPPRLELDTRRVLVRAGEVVIADTRAALRLLETASPPTFYLPPEDVDPSRVIPAQGSSRCEWKGVARYFDVELPGQDLRLANAAWGYPSPFDDYARLAGYLAFYATKLDCSVDGEPVTPQPGGLYGGWITHELVGPFKGDPGSGGW